MTADVSARPDRVLLVWDAPNMDMSLGSLLGARPTSSFRPRFYAVGRWLLDVAGPDAVAEACVFTIVVASRDGQAFRQALEARIAKVTCVTVIGFHEYANFAMASEDIDFLDL